MNTVTKYSVSDAATLYKKSRATLYKDIKNGTLSRDHDGLIDFSELLRVYGEPFDTKRIDTSSIQIQNTPEYTDKTVIELKNQIDFLKRQLEKAEDREAKANARIDTLLTLIEMKPTVVKEHIHQTKNDDIAIDPQSEKVELPTEQQPEEPKRYPIPEQVETEPEQRGFWSRFFKPYG